MHAICELVTVATSELHLSAVPAAALCRGRGRGRVLFLHFLQPLIIQLKGSVGAHLIGIKGADYNSCVEAG